MRTFKRTLTFDQSQLNHLRIVFISDLHVGHTSFSEKHLKSFLKENMERPNTWLIGLGDHMECVVPADLKRYQLSQAVYDSEDPDAVLDYQTSKVVELLQPYQDRIIGLAMGNHELTIVKRYGHNPHRRVCDGLGCDDLGYSFLIRLLCKPEAKNYRPHINSVVVYGCHGWGGNSRTAGGNVTKYSRALETYEADLYVFGHSHDQFTREIPRIMVDTAGKVKHRPAMVVNVGTFKKTMSNTAIPTWEESKGFPPRTLGGIVVKIHPSKHARAILKVES